MKQIRLLCLLITAICTAQFATAGDHEFTGPSPWPEIRKERISRLLPEAMIASGQAAWLILCRENDNDPLADHIGGENASGTAAFLFYIDESGFHSRVFSPIGEATALTDLAIHDVVVPVPRGESAIQHAAAFLLEQNFVRLAVNTSSSNAQADGLSHAQHQALVAAL
ncbi:MAG: aminopeptidase P family protein, partial [Gammaproteobacteria bacterium]